CWPGTWGVNCKFRCNQCKSDCNKLNGRCDTCEPGYFNPSYGPFNCSTECPAMTYGFECRGSCYSKCSKECLDKQLGTCSTLTGVPFLVATYHYYFLVLLIIPVMTVVSELIRLKTSGSVDDGEDVQDYWGYPFYRRASETTRKFYPDDHLDDFRDDDDDLDDFDIDDLDLYGEDYLDEVDPQVVPMEEPTKQVILIQNLLKNKRETCPPPGKVKGYTVERTFMALFNTESQNIVNDFSFGIEESNYQGTVFLKVDQLNTTRMQ
ncbi:multiple epidermal growth factor-like domains protein 10, partial [Biomphalaria glabrata]